MPARKTKKRVVKRKPAVKKGKGILKKLKRGARKAKRGVKRAARKTAKVATKGVRELRKRKIVSKGLKLGADVGGELGLTKAQQTKLRVASKVSRKLGFGKQGGALVSSPFGSLGEMSNDTLADPRNHLSRGKMFSPRGKSGRGNNGVVILDATSAFAYTDLPFVSGSGVIVSQ